MKKYTSPTVLFVKLVYDIISTSDTMTRGDGPQPGRAEAPRYIWDE